jgi:hypothetical protein
VHRTVGRILACTWCSSDGKAAIDYQIGGSVKALGLRREVDHQFRNLRGIAKRLSGGACTNVWYTASADPAVRCISSQKGIACHIGVITPLGKIVLTRMPSPRWAHSSSTAFANIRTAALLLIGLISR